MTFKLHKRCFLLFLFFLGFILPVSATHILGSDLTYKSVGQDKFEIKQTLYVDCNGPTLTNTTIQIHCGALSYDRVISGPVKTHITKYCDTFTQSPCATNQWGVDKYVWTDTINFAQAPYTQFKAQNCCNIYLATKKHCCRISSDMNAASGKNEFYNESMVNICNSNQFKNNSVTLTNEPIFRPCCNQPYHFNLGAIDPDGDSLAYEFSDPLAAHAMPTTPLKPWSKDYPFSPYCPTMRDSVNCNPVPIAKPPIGIFLDAKNGDLIFTPTKCNQTSILVLKVKEYRMNPKTKQMELVGFVIRDVSIFVTNCSGNNVPSLSGPFKYTVKEGQKIQFTIKSKDNPLVVPPPGVSTIDTTSLAWNEGISGATFVISNPTTREKNADFVWTPPVGSGRTAPYTFTVEVSDDHCPYSARAIRAYEVCVEKTVSSAHLKAQPNLLIYPNPFVISETLNLAIAGEQIQSIQVYDITGKQLEELKQPASSFKLNSITINGIYVLVVKTETQAYSVQINALDK